MTGRRPSTGRRAPFHGGRRSDVIMRVRHRRVPLSRQHRLEEPQTNMMSNSHRLLVGVAAFIGFAPLALSAQEATNVTGTVTSSQAPVENVAVSIPELRIGGYTDQAGKYRIVA